MPLTVRFMRRQDISQVTEIDHDAFPTEWPPTNFPRELENKLAYYIVACETDNTTPQSDSKSSTREIQPGILSRVRRIFVRSPIPKDDPVKKAGFWVLPGCGYYQMKPISPASPHTKTIVVRALAKLY